MAIKKKRNVGLLKEILFLVHVNEDVIDKNQNDDVFVTKHTLQVEFDVITSAVDI